MAKENYTPKHSDGELLDFMDRNAVKFDAIPLQSHSEHYGFKMFSLLTQHISGDSVRECLDKGMEIERKKNLCLHKRL